MAFRLLRALQGRDRRARRPAAGQDIFPYAYALVTGTSRVALTLHAGGLEMFREKVIDVVLWAFALSALVMAWWLGFQWRT
jgi:hypothetical protein